MVKCLEELAHDQEVLGSTPVILLSRELAVCFWICERKERMEEAMLL